MEKIEALVEEILACKGEKNLPGFENLAGLEQKIDKLVFALYGQATEEIGVVLGL